MSATTTWLSGLVRRRYGRMVPAILGVSLTIAMLAILGVFINASAATMTQRALGDVPVDWQVEVVPGADVNAVQQELQRTGHAKTIEPVGYADVSGFTAVSGGTTQTTGGGKVLGITSTYWKNFPSQLRPMLGRSDGILIAQQTAANLHVSVGDNLTVLRMGLRRASMESSICHKRTRCFRRSESPRAPRPKRRPTTCSSFRSMSGINGSTSRAWSAWERRTSSCT